jgi:Rrf2 family transcriptional regulator, iron-sulfur cluster assembly transcription factor
MLFSKTFGYSLRGILYVAMQNKEKPRVQIDEIAEALKLPRYFMGKIMNRIAKEGVLISLKGHNGGFCIDENTLAISLMKLCELTGEDQSPERCVLNFKACDCNNPCPIHQRVESLRREWLQLLRKTTIGDLLNNNQPDFLRSIAVM